MSVFKTGKGNNSEYISRKELEKTYEQQKKLFNQLLNEQQNKIDELVEYVSARFGEDLMNSDINQKFKEIEKKVSESLNSFKDEITSQNSNYNIEREKTLGVQTELYNECCKLIEKNEEDIKNIEQAMLQKDIQMSELNKSWEELQAEGKEYKKFIKDEFSSTNKKINKINYIGLSNKFDKKINTEIKKLQTKIDNINKAITENVNSIDNNNSLNNKQILEKFEELNKAIEENKKEINSFNIDLLENTNKLREEINSKDTLLDENKNNFKELNKFIKDGEIAINNLEEKINNNNTKLLDYNKEAKKNAKAIEDLNNIIVGIKKLSDEANTKLVKVQEVADINLDKIKEQILFKMDKIDEKNKAYKEKIISYNKQLYKNLQNTESNFNKLQQAFSEIDETIKQQMLELKEELNNKSTQIDQLNQKIESKKEEPKLNLDELKKQTESILTNTDAKIEQINNSFAKIQENNININTVVKEMQKNIDSSIGKVGKEITKLQNETNLLSKKQENSTNIEELKKDYNSYVTKVNNALGKLSKAITGIQEKNVETNKNLQIKLKAYIDNKNTINNNKINSIINKLSLSIAEREELQKIEMEQLLNKKLKAIQKENERLLQKKIEELNNFVLNQTSFNNTQNFHLIENKKIQAKKKKSIYDPIDEDQILKQSASNNRNLKTGQTGKSQLLKFFYDDED